MPLLNTDLQLLDAMSRDAHRPNHYISMLMTHCDNTTYVCIHLMWASVCDLQGTCVLEAASDMAESLDDKYKVAENPR